ncbi:hypothetical protein INT46_008903 [Mucor plumbeus]|uniref:Uncharacterized protein n=1 Tax=Mucor plumbeus TaxID=97098 RepID=A0A8H7QIV1_9FUNG|nr:hypothetical protein INT46_008903 [Mucor plumbeus]
MYKSLIQETRLKTLELYKSLLKSSKPYDNLQNAIRQKFKSNKCTTSRKKTLTLLTEAEETLKYLNKGNNGDQEIVSKVNAYIQKYIKPSKVIPSNRYNFDRCTHKYQKPLPKAPKKQKQSKIVERKPYQIAITTKHAIGFVFKRVRGWRQPVKTSMMIKNRVKANQVRIDKFQSYKLQLEMIRGERTFLQNLGCLPKDKLMGYENNIKMALTAYNIKDTQNRQSVNPDNEP